MATSTLIPVEEYLRTVYRPDCDYVDGFIEERNLGELSHGWVQGNVVGAFRSRYEATGLAAIPEWRFQIAPTRFRVPDVVVTLGRPREQILTQPPMLCVEILSPEDRAARVNARIREYLEFGVPAVWLIDPERKTLTIYRRTSFEEVAGPSVRVDGSDVDIPLAEIFD